MEVCFKGRFAICFTHIHRQQLAVGALSKIRKSHVPSRIAAVIVNGLSEEGSQERMWLALAITVPLFSKIISNFERNSLCMSNLSAKSTRCALPCNALYISFFILGTVFVRLSRASLSSSGNFRKQRIFLKQFCVLRMDEPLPFLIVGHYQMRILSFPSIPI